VELRGVEPLPVDTTVLPITLQPRNFTVKTVPDTLISLTFEDATPILFLPHASSLKTVDRKIELIY